MTIEASLMSEVANSAVPTKVDRAAYLMNLLKLRPDLPADEDVVGLQGIRDRATVHVQEFAIPSTRDEEWRFTDLSALLQTKFQAVSHPGTLSFTQIAAYLLPETVNSRLVFVDGVYAADLSAVDDLPAGVMVGNLAAVAQFIPTLNQYLAQQLGADEVFTALNSASMADGAVVWIPANLVVETPIHLVFVSTAIAPTLSHPRCLVVAEANSQVTLVEDYGALSGGNYFTNAVTEVWVGRNAMVNHTRIQRDSEAAVHIGKTAVSQARDSRYRCTAVNVGGKLSRHHVEIYQTGAQTETTLNALTMIAGEQIGDTHSLIAFSQPHGTSNQVNKCIVNDSARAVFNGRIVVPKLAQLTNAAQLSRNLLLSPKARVDTKPQLEIVANDVKCAHGATVSQLEDDEVFYLQSRGLAAADARKLLTYGFAIEIIDHIPISALRDQLATHVRCQTPSP
jgi:Fe-S cluster assembly protein SufD